MKQVTHKANGREFLLVELPDGGDMDNLNLQFLSHGQHKMLGYGDEIQEPIAAQIVEDANEQLLDFYVHYKDYESKSWEDDYSEATDSLASLLRSHSLNPSTTLILEKL